MNKLVYLLTILMSCFLTHVAVGAETQNASQGRLDPKAALNRLMEGNKRFMTDQNLCPERNEVRRAATVAKQKPFAIVLGCSDSRVPPEIAFDQGIGDIFVVRIAGNVASTLELESIEYSALVNDSSIVMVLGHKNCGAVSAVMEGNTKGVEGLAALIKPAVLQAKKENKPLEDAIIDNIHNSVDRIKKSAAIQKLIQDGTIDVVGGYYDLATGQVKIVTK